MPNTYFQFKQFSINQVKSSMKVCTDSCLFGAWVSEKLGTSTLQPSRVLDIGTGTGLLSLMIAQKSRAMIDAVEIDISSFEEAAENFRQSPWSGQLQAFHSGIQQWESNSKYDLIISNPPFFQHDLRSPHQNRNMAKHNDGLTFQELLTSIEKNLAPLGNFAVLLPAHRTLEWNSLVSDSGYFLMDEIEVRQSPNHPVFRKLLFFGCVPVTPTSKEVSIKKELGVYSDPFKSLLKDYYLQATLFPER